VKEIAGRKKPGFWEKPGFYALLLAAVLVGCAATETATLPPAAAPTQTTPVVPTPTPTSEAMGADANAGAGAVLVSRRTDTPPVIDGQIEDLWTSAEPLRVPLTWGQKGTAHALDVTLRALHTGEAISFLAQWPGEPPSGDEDTTYNAFTLHWRIPEPAADRLDCTVVCHTAFADGKGRFAYANAETIPQGGSGALDAAGGWEAGTWTLEWRRPLASANPFDLQFDDREGSFPFMVKIFARQEGRPDPVSERYVLVFGEQP
jgi:hypothetical protein